MDALLRLQSVKRAKHGVVFVVGGDDVIARLEEAVKGDIECFRSIGGEDNSLR